MPAAPSPGLLGARLSLLFFLDIAVIAAYSPLLSLHLSGSLGLTPKEIALVYAVAPLTSLVGPPLVGWVADRLLRAEWSLTAVNVLRVMALLLAARADTLGEVMLAMAMVGLLTGPSVVLCLSIAFHHLKDGRQIGRTRVWGAVSWILTLWITSAYMAALGPLAAQLTHTASTFRFAAVLAALVAGYALTLPATPPTSRGTRKLVLVEAFGLLRSSSFRTLVVASALAAMCLQFHFMLWPLFYTDAVTGLGLDVAVASRASSLSQALELLLFPALAMLLRRFTLRQVLLVGFLAWPLRFLANVIGSPPSMVIGAQLLHGVNVVCGTTTAQIAVDEVAPAGARASSHALMTAMTSGVGNLAGQLLCGVVLAASALPGGGYRWRLVFLVPLVLGLLATGLLAAKFRREPTPT